MYLFLVKIFFGCLCNIFYFVGPPGYPSTSSPRPGGPPGPPGSAPPPAWGSSGPPPPGYGGPPGYGNGPTAVGSQPPGAWGPPRHGGPAGPMSRPGYRPGMPGPGQAGMPRQVSRLFATFHK